jgi:hypothetical protein
MCCLTNARRFAAGCAVFALLGGTTARAVPPVTEFSYGGRNGYDIPHYQPQHPTVSPYVALAGRSGLANAGTYYSVVRPQIAQRSFNNAQSAAVRRIDEQQSQLQRQSQTKNQRTTGHSFGFMTQSRYFGTVNSNR